MRNKFFKSVFFILVSVVFILSVYQIFLYISETNRNEKAVDDLEQKTTISSDGEAVADNSFPFNLDFNELQKENEDIVAWLYCENTPINYPVLKGTDNEYYLNHSVNGNYNKNGSLFIDCRCNSNFTDFNTIVYGHNMKTEKMFGSLTNYKKQSYYDEHPTLYLIMPDYNYKIELFSGFVASADSDLYALLKSVDEKKEFINTAIKKSTFISTVSVCETDTIITLSTCSYEYSNARYVVIGKIDNIN